MLRFAVLAAWLEREKIKFFSKTDPAGDSDGPMDEEWMDGKMIDLSTQQNNIMILKRTKNEQKVSPKQSWSLYLRKLLPNVPKQLQ